LFRYRLGNSGVGHFVFCQKNFKLKSLSRQNTRPDLGGLFRRKNISQVERHLAWLADFDL